MSPYAEALQNALRSAPYARWLDLRVVEVEGEALGLMPYAEALIGNPVLPALHGGAVAAFLELVAAAHVCAEQGLARPPQPVGVSIDYLGSGRAQDTYARAEVRRMGRRVVNVRAEAWQDDRRTPIAALHGHVLLPSAEAQGETREVGEPEAGR